MNRYQLVSLAVCALALPVYGQVELETSILFPLDTEVSIFDFGHSLVVEDGVIAAGAPRSAGFEGAAFLVDRVSGAQLVRFLPSEPATNSQFGLSIAMDDGVVAVGSIASVVGSQSGKVYLFDADSSSPTFGDELMVLLPSDGAAGDQFGFSVAMGDGVVAIGAPFDDDHGTSSGSVYLFDADPGSVSFGEQLAKITASDAAPFDEFGTSIDIDDGQLVVGAWQSAGLGGSAYIFNSDPLSAGLGDELSILSGIGVSGSVEFGRAVSIDNQMIAVASRLEGTGSVRIFDADPLSVDYGMQTNKLTSSVAGLVGRFGHSVSIRDGQVAVGTPLANINGFGSGTAFRFDAETGEQLEHYLSSVGRSFDQFGFAVDIDTDGVVVVGAIGFIQPNNNGGAAFVFGGEGAECVADFTDDGVLNFFDVSGFLAFFQLGNPAADLNGDGLFNFFDVSEFLAAFSAGCP